MDILPSSIPIFQYVIKEHVEARRKIIKFILEKQYIINTHTENEKKLLDTIKNSFDDNTKTNGLKKDILNTILNKYKYDKQPETYI